MHYPALHKKGADSKAPFKNKQTLSEYDLTGFVK